eukprot:COSAG02_NODE_15373_length_1176_cov_2.160631_1_plen_78_part_00
MSNHVPGSLGIRGMHDSNDAKCHKHTVHKGLMPGVCKWYVFMPAPVHVRLTHSAHYVIQLAPAHPLSAGNVEALGRN